VFATTKALHKAPVIEKSHKQGERGRYLVLPQKVAEQVEQAYREQKTGTVQPHQSGQTVQYAQTVPVRLNRSGLTVPVRVNRSGLTVPVSTRSRPFVRVRARMDSPEGDPHFDNRASVGDRGGPADCVCGCSC
jgi:hypothetical protein